MTMTSNDLEAFQIGTDFAMRNKSKVCVGKTTKNPYISYGTASRAQRDRSKLYKNENVCNFYQRGTGLGTYAGLMCLNGTRNIIDQCTTYDLLNPAVATTFSHLHQLPSPYPLQENNFHPRCTNVAVRPKNQSSGQLPFHYDSTDYSKLMDIIYVPLENSSDEKKNLNVAVFDTCDLLENKQEYMNQKGFILHTYVDGYMVKLKLNSVINGHCQVIDNSDLLFKTHKQKVNQVVIVKYIDKTILKAVRENKFHDKHTNMMCASYMKKIMDLKQEHNFEGDICPKCKKKINITNENVNEFLNIFADYLSKNEQKYMQCC